MKTQLIFPIATAFLGFAAGWLLKPGASPAPAIVSQPPPRPERQAPAAPEAEPPPVTGRSTPSDRQSRTFEAPKPTLDGIQSRDDAKFARLVEALSLNEDQQKILSDAVKQAEATLNPETRLDPELVLEAALEAASTVEKALAASLTPEQAAAFQALRERAKQNTIENNSQRQISDLSKITDLSPEQRDQMLGAVRDELAARYQSRPAGLDLMMESSVLPLGGTFVSESGVERMLFNKAQPEGTDRDVAFTELQKKNLDAEFERYKPFLTPAQAARLQVDIEERKKAVDAVRELLR